MSSNMWDQIEIKLPIAIQQVCDDLVGEALSVDGLTSILRERYTRGSEEHGGEWLDWESPMFWENIKEEIHDAVLYRAMDLVRHEQARKYGDLNASYNQAIEADMWNARASLGTWQGNNTQTETGESE